MTDKRNGVDDARRERANRLARNAVADGRLVAGSESKWASAMVVDPGVESILAGLAPGLPPEPTRASPTRAVGALVDTESVFSREHVRIDIRSRNPILDDARQVMPHNVAAASTERPTPTLFNSGDIPPYTASGNDPTKLLQVPWQMRHRAAKADQAEWARIFNTYADLSAEDAVVEMMFEPADPANGEYEARMSDWLSGR